MRNDAIHTDHITHRGRKFRVDHFYDNDHGAPWEENDGHGPVSEWTMRDNLPGELVLCTDRSLRRYYDYAAAVRIAKRDGWGHANTPATATKNQKAAIAALANFEYLRAWCNDQWNYIGIEATQIETTGDGEEIDGESSALWGIESNSGAYLEEVARELADEICNTITKREAAELAKIESRMQRTREHVRAWLSEYRAIVRELGERNFPTLCDTARRNLQREILELNAMRNRARELRNLAALGA